MGKIQIDGLERTIRSLDKLGNNSKEIVVEGVKVGAGIIADEVRKNINAMPIVNGFGTESHPLSGGATQGQKQGLQESLGISPVQRYGEGFNASIGFDGYNKTITKKYPKGQPNQLVARGIESGTSWKRKYPFIRPAVTKAKKRAVEQTEEIITTKVKEIMEE